jgi:hypothetical protein
MSPTRRLCLLVSVWILANQMQAQSPDSLAAPASILPQNAANWQTPYTPMRGRVGLYVGDQAGGPVRYNTRFPEVKSNPHPASYYHAPAFAGIEAELATSKGALLMGALLRRDLWHSAITGRAVNHLGETWLVESFDFSDQAVFVGWVFGQRYQEAMWSADFAIVYDQGRLVTGLSRPTDVEAVKATVNIRAFSLRARLQRAIIGSRALQVTLGPEIHVPLASKITETSDAELRGWVAENLQLKNSAAVGLSLMTSLRF